VIGAIDWLTFLGGGPNTPGLRQAFEGGVDVALPVVGQILAGLVVGFVVAKLAHTWGRS
jgi:hypothetical protein